jgi:hypothetical protein
MHSHDTTIFHCLLCAVPCTGWGAHLQHDCPLVPGALLHALRAVALHLQHQQWTTRWLSTTSFVAAHGIADAVSWKLVRDPEVHPGDPGVLVTWSGLFWCLGGHKLPTALRKELIVAYLTAADSWLRMGPDQRWNALANPADPSLDSLGVASRVPMLCTILRHLLHVPQAHIHGPSASTVGQLCEHQPPVAPEAAACPTAITTRIGCACSIQHLASPECYVLSILPRPPAVRDAAHQLIHAPDGMALVYTHGAISPILLRALDVLFPPPSQAPVSPPMRTRRGVVCQCAAPALPICPAGGQAVVLEAWHPYTPLVPLLAVPISTEM